MKKNERKRGDEAYLMPSDYVGAESNASVGHDLQRAAQADRRRQVMLHVGTSASTFAINITGMEGFDMSGYIHHMYTETRVPFRTLFEAAASIHKITDALDYPQRGYRIRSWRDAPNPFAGYGDEDRLMRRYGAGHHSGGVPSRGGQLRRDPDSGASRAGGGAEGDAKPLVTVVIRIQYRQNASWQGEALCSGRATVKFRSVLELMMLIAEACDDFQNGDVARSGLGEPSGQDEYAGEEYLPEGDGGEFGGSA